MESKNTDPGASDVGNQIYVASSWRNIAQAGIVAMLRAIGYSVYDFKHPEPGNEGFHWSAIDPNWKAWEPDLYAAALHDPIAESGFAFDMNALMACEVCVLVLPCGRSAHIEAGWAKGAGKKLLILVLQKEEPELMYKMADAVCTSLPQMFDQLAEWLPGVESKEDPREAVSA